MERENKLYSWIRIILVWIICAIIILLIKHNVMAIAFIKSTSMYPTLNDSEFVLLSRVKRLTKSEYKVGDIIMFEAPSDVKQYIYEVDLKNPVAIYNYEPEGVVNRFLYYSLGATKISYVKRIVAVEGDFVQIEGSILYVNGEKVIEDYLPEGTTISSGGYYNNITVPEGYVYVLGDNREESLDSRILGCIPVEKIEGKVLFK